MKQIGSYQAKTHLPRLLDRVAHGERLCITKNGSPVAMLIPFSAPSQRRPKDAIQQIKKFRAGLSLRGLSLKAMIREGRKY